MIGEFRKNFHLGACLSYLKIHSLVFFFKQKTAYEMCGRDWSSDVCSSDLCGFCFLSQFFVSFNRIIFYKLMLMLEIFAVGVVSDRKSVV